ncbi:MAG: flagellin [Acidobacteriaceae bacterium]
MSLGVLNNIAAIYAENNLNQTNASLQNVLTQLSSGSRINSGADDAAGLSLANSLGANAAALTQSATNASSGVGLLQVADGALSQVTNLLNRAITLATEASNGTLNTSQDAAANQEYQSILTEINNIGSTTTYNDNAVFGSNTAIFTGDASIIGSSTDTLSIKSLSSSSVGDVGGTISQASVQGSTDVYTATAATDTWTGTLSLNGSNVVLNSAGETQAQIAASINGANISGISASVNTAGTVLTINDTASTTAPTVATLTLKTGTSGDTNTGVATNNVTILENGIQYTEGTGANLSTTDLSSSANAQTALTAVNSAITDVAAQRGYLGSQINTLNAESNVESTQETNVVSAQNNIMATDYGQATSELSKYQILSQTGISALAQANTVQQEVLKLLQ